MHKYMGAAHLFQDIKKYYSSYKLILNLQIQSTNKTINKLNFFTKESKRTKVDYSKEL